MRPTTIPDTEIWAGAQRIIVSPPDGDLTNNTIRPVEMLAEQLHGVPVYSARCILEPGDLEILQDGGNVWLDPDYCGTGCRAAAINAREQQIRGLKAELDRVEQLADSPAEGAIAKALP